MFKTLVFFYTKKRDLSLSNQYLASKREKLNLKPGAQARSTYHYYNLHK